ncbi:hypothetical protein [Acidianus manzaensis]|uniref:Uncharacterized protein n=1 Tax=Acidianus manzaensis TaxID=282676 RepID=A0A1W6JYA6_9CREN|nr:hypothetical protein [Acidianus manzaensis]ARM75243.1 hypothetical protein B6F84_03810 [Acidianus manzaensis]
MYDEEGRLQELISKLSSKNKDEKHEAWNNIQEMIKSSKINKEIIKDLMCYEDKGSRYRVWNYVSEMLNQGILDKNDVIEKAKCFYDLLKDEDETIRGLSWYSTLPQLIDILDKQEILNIISFCESLLNSDEWKDLIKETCDDLNKNID